MSTASVTGAAALLVEVLSLARAANVDVRYCDVGQDACVIHVETVSDAEVLCRAIDARERKVGKSVDWTHYSRPPHFLARHIASGIVAPGGVHTAIIEVAA